MKDLQDRKALARQSAFARREVAHANRGDESARLLCEVLSTHRGLPLSGYMPIRTEIDPRPAMAQAADHGIVGVPVIAGPGQPLKFARWTPETRLIDGTFGAGTPAAPDYFEPEVVIVPLVAFDACGGRLGYGGGFFDRTLEVLRRRRPTLAIGFAFDEQETDRLPLEPTDQPLDVLVTQSRVLAFSDRARGPGASRALQGTSRHDGSPVARDG